jgi:hypothetical protein
MNTIHSEYKVYEENEKSQEVEAVSFTTPEDILLAWEGMQALRKKEKEVPGIEWMEFLDWMSSR